MSRPRAPIVSAAMRIEKLERRARGYLDKAQDLIAKARVLRQEFAQDPTLMPWRGDGADPPLGSFAESNPHANQIAPGYTTGSA